MPVEKQSGVSFPTPGSYLVFKIMNCSLWTCSKILMPYSIQFINNYKFLLWPLSGPAFLLFFLSPTENYQPGGFIFQCYISLPFHTAYGVLKAKVLKWVPIPFTCSTQLNDMPRAPVVPLLVHVEHLNFHWSWGVSQCAARG